jgi:hypothetical protein
MGDVRQFIVSLDKWGDQVPRKVGQIQRAISFEVFKNVITGTPVDTGRARASWFINVASPIRAVAPERPAGTAAAAAAEAESLGRFAEVVPDRVTGLETIYITNNLPYIVRLAEGTSHQAPKGWVEQAVQAGARLGDAIVIKD